MANRSGFHTATIALLASIAFARTASAQQAPLPDSLIALDDPAGRQLLTSSDADTDFFRLVNHWVTQQHGSYCGVATTVTVLNAMQLRAPDVPGQSPYNSFTQDNVFDGDAARVLTANRVAHGGMDIDQLGAFLTAHGTRAQVVHARESSLERFRLAAAQNLREPGNYIVINYDRAGVGQETMGHISPLGAYNSAADRFLILDVARYKYPAVWATTTDLWRAMSSNDLSTGRSRGYVLVSYALHEGRVVGPLAHTGLPRFVWIVLAVVFAAGVLVGALAFALVRRFRTRRT